MFHERGFAATSKTGRLANWPRNPKMAA